MSNALPLTSRSDVDAAKRLIASASLRYEETYDLLAGFFYDSRLVGCGARHGRVLKMLVIDEKHRGGDLLAEIVTELITLDQTSRPGSHFIFAKPCAINAFERLNFKTLVRHPKTGLGILENQNGLSHFFRRHASCVQSGDSGAVVINADPFTLGHQFLTEQAAAQVDKLYVFVPAEGDFLFASEVRQTLAIMGTRHLNNVCVIDAGAYVLNYAEFPGYFLKANESRERVWMEMDTELFVSHIAPFFHITTRFVGTEPLNPSAHTHHQVLRVRLPERQLKLIEMKRLKIGDFWISAGSVRQAVRSGEKEGLHAWVPAITGEYLKLIIENSVQSGHEINDGGCYTNA